MVSTAETIDDLIRSGAPRPLLSRSAEVRLGPRHRELLDQLEALFRDRGFASFTIADLARTVGCSRRTLYELAPSKDQLVLVVLDRFLHRMGRTALGAVQPDSPLIDQLRQYIEGGIDFQMYAPLFDDLADEAPLRRLVDRHYRYVMSVLERMIALGVERGEFNPVTASVVAATITGASLYLMQPEISDDTGLSAERLVGEMLDLTLASLPVNQHYGG
ncbi:MAG: TetR/AcrR family transcriptional regulator [Acidimicrobiales bacterium]